VTFRIFIPGVPKPQGSKTSGVNRQTGKSFLREDNKGTKPWRKVMVVALQEQDSRPLTVFDSAVWVRLRFVFLRPKSHKPDSLPTSKLLGDVDKLTRNVLDALTQAKVITDDKFVVKLRDVEKVYGPNPGVHIEIGPAVPNPFGEGLAAPLQLLTPLLDLPDPTRGGPEIPPTPETSVIDLAAAWGYVDRIPGPVDYGVCPRCRHAPLKPRSHGGVECTECDYWFCY